MIQHFYYTQYGEDRIGVMVEWKPGLQMFVLDVRGGDGSLYWQVTSRRTMLHDDLALVPIRAALQRLQITVPDAMLRNVLADAVADVEHGERCAAGTYVYSAEGHYIRHAPRVW